jgi:L-ornithine Nalpha-acyltransferase
MPIRPDPVDRSTSLAARMLGGLQKGSAILTPSGFRARTMPQPDGLDGVLGRIGPLEIRLAQTHKDVKRAQKLRYRVFYEEMSAVPDIMSRLKRRDIDAYDAICDHLLVIDHDAPPEAIGKSGSGRRKPKVVGTYRLLRQEVAERHEGFYSAGEFDIQPLLDAHPGKRFLELGRSCVLRPYRDKRTVELLWHGVWTYVRRHGMDVMFGCASLEGTDPARLALPLSFLHHHAQAPAEWSASAMRSRRVDMNILPAADINPKAALHSLPPLIKGYLRVGARFGDGAVVDRQFGATDVLVVLPVSAIHARYIGHFGADATRHAA